jgi:hypothetical protein
MRKVVMFHSVALFSRFHHFQKTIFSSPHLQDLTLVCIYLWGFLEGNISVSLYSKSTEHTGKYYPKPAEQLSLSTFSFLYGSSACKHAS